jgi:hypothetical protein
MPAATLLTHQEAAIAGDLRRPVQPSVLSRGPTFLRLLVPRPPARWLVLRPPSGPWRLGPPLGTPPPCTADCSLPPCTTECSSPWTARPGPSPSSATSSIPQTRGRPENLVLRMLSTWAVLHAAPSIPAPTSTRSRMLPWPGRTDEQDRRRRTIFTLGDVPASRPARRGQFLRNITALSEILNVGATGGMPELIHSGNILDFNRKCYFGCDTCTL